MKKITGILGWPAHIVVIAILIGLNSLQDPPTVSAAQEDSPAAATKVPADTAKFYLDCPDTTVVEGESVDVFLVRVTNHEHSANFGAYWQTRPGTADSTDYVHQDSDVVWSNDSERNANRAKRTFRTRQDSVLEGDETFTVRFTPTSNVVDMSNPERDNKCVITIIDDEFKITDLDIVSTPILTDTYGQDEVIEIEATFSGLSSVNVEEGEQGPALGLWVGDKWKSAPYLRGSGTKKLVFGYTVQSTDQDDNGIKMDGGYQDDDGTWHNFLRHTKIHPIVLGVVATSIVPYRRYSGFSDQASHKVDGGIDNIVPTVSNVSFHTDAGSDSTFAIGDVVIAKVKFSEVVGVSGGPTLSVVVGADTVEARYQPADHNSLVNYSDTHKFAFQVSEGLSDSSGISIIANSLSLPVGESEYIQDRGENNAVLTHTAIATDSSRKVDGIRPFVATAELTSTPPDTDGYAIGDSVEVTIRFSEPVDITGSPEYILALRDRVAALASYVESSDTEAVFRYTIQEGDFSIDGIQLPVAALEVDIPGVQPSYRGTINDLVGNRIDYRSGEAFVPPDSDHKVDGVRPIYTRSETSTDGLTVTIYFSEEIDVHPMIVSLSNLLDIELGRIIKAVAGITVNNRVVEPSNASISGSDITLTLSTAITEGDTAKVDYNNHFARNAPGFFLDTAGNALAFFSYQDVTNNSTVAAGTAITVDLVLTPTVGFTVTEGVTATYTVALNTQPSADVTVTISSSDSDKLSTNLTSLTFTAQNWNTAQTVTMTAAQDDDSIDYWVRLTHTASGGGYDSVVVGINVIIDDDDD